MTDKLPIVHYNSEEKNSFKKLIIISALKILQPFP